MFKNTASQKVRVFAFDTTTGAAKTGDAANIAAYVSKDYGAVTQLTDTSATEEDSTNAKGYYLFDISQTETNADTILISAKSSTANISVIGAPATIYTRPVNFTTLSVDSNGRVDVIKIAGTTQTARDIGASVLLSSGTGTGQLDFTSGVVKANATQLAGQTITAAAGVTFPTSVASPTNITAGTITTVTNLTNAPTSGDLTATMKTSVTTAATAATPTAAAVTGAVGSVTGAVGSVSGNVGGNVVGSVASVTAGVTLATSAVTAIWDKLTSALTTAGSIGKLLVDNIDAAISSRSTVTTAQVNTECDIALSDVGLTSTVTGRIDATVSSRLALASYTAPLDAAGVRSAVGLASANLDTQLSIIDGIADEILADTGTDGVIVATNNDKTGYSLAQTFPANFDALDITAGGAVTAGTVSDKTGYALSQTFPANFDALDISAGGEVTAGTVNDKTGYELTQAFPANFADLEITSGKVTVGTNDDKTGYSLTQTFPANFDALAISNAGEVTVGTNNDKTGYELTAAPLDDAGIRAAVGLASANLDVQLGPLSNLDQAVSTRLAAADYTAPDNTTIAAISDFVDTEISAIKAKTDLIPASPAATGDIPSASSIASEVWASIIEGSYSALQFMRLFGAALIGKASGLDTTTAVYRNTADTKNRISATVDADGNRSAVTLDPS